MAYSKFHADWKDFPDTTTPITEAALEHIEQGIVDVETAAAAALAAKRLDQIVAPTGDVSLNNQKIIGLGTPTANTDAATKAYVDAVAQGLDVKMSVRAATTANITLSGAQTIDGVAVVATNRVLVKNQTTGADNGIYVAAAGAWSRATDADVDAEVTAGMFTFVEAGTVAADQGWVLITNNPITVGTTALSFSQFSGGGGTVAATAVTVDSTTLVGTGTNAQAVFEELDDGIANHLADTSAAHAASAIAFTPVGTVSATDVQAAIAEVASEGGGGGGSASDATVTFTDIVTNNSSTTKHGFLPKLNNNRSSYMDGKGTWSAQHSFHEWYVDNAAIAGGDGHSPAGAFTTFAAAMAVVQPRDVIYVLSDLSENLTLSVANIAVIGVGNQRFLYGTGSTSINSITVNITAAEVRFENFFIWGHAGFKGVHLALNLSSQEQYLQYISIDGTGGSMTATYHSCSPLPGTGIGGIGILYHHCDTGYNERIRVLNCSIGIAGGTWSTRQTFMWLRSSQCMQAMVIGLYTGPHTGPIQTGSLVYGGPNQEQTGSWIIKQWTDTSSYNTDQTGAIAHIDIIGGGGNVFGAGQSNYSGELGNNNVFEHVDLTEGLDYNFVRIGSKGNTFINCANGPSTFWATMGQRNYYLNFVLQENFWLYSDYNVMENAKFNQALATIRGPGNINTFKNCHMDTIVMTGAGNIYQNCTFNATPATTLANLGASATCSYFKYPKVITYSSTMATDIANGGPFEITATNGTAFTISNPTNSNNWSSPGTILITDLVLTYNIKNSSGGTMGNITWGSKFLLDATGFVKPANGKRKTISFYRSTAEDLWIQVGPTSADM